MIVKRLRIRSHGASFSIDHSHRIRYDVEDGLELRNAPCEIFAVVFSLGDVDTGEEETARVARRRPTTDALAQWGECDLDETTSSARLKGNARGNNRDAVERTVDLIREISEGVRKRVVNRTVQSARCIETRELSIAQVRADEF